MIYIIIKWLVKNLRNLIKLFEGKKIRYGLIFNSLFMAISLIKRFKTFRFVRWIILGFGIANLIFSIFIVISFSDIDFSKFEIPTLSMIFSIIIGILPVFFTDSYFYIYNAVKESSRTLLRSIIGNIVTPEFNFETNNLNGVTEQEYDDFMDENFKDKDQDTEMNKSNKTKYLLILAGITIVGLGVVYYYHPEYYALMYEYISNIFNRRGGDPDSGTNNNMDNNLSNERLRGRAAHDIITRTVNKVNNNCAASYSYLSIIKKDHFSDNSDFLQRIEELISNNDKSLQNFSKLPEPTLMDIDIAKYNELLNYNNQLKDFIETQKVIKSNLHPPLMGSTCPAGIKPETIDSIPSSPENAPQDLLSSQETIKPKTNQTLLDKFFIKKENVTFNIPPADTSSSSSSIYIEDTRTNVENPPSVSETEIPDSVEKTLNTVENKTKIKNIWKRFKSKKPPVGETTIEPDYDSSIKTRNSSISDYPTVPESD